MKQPREDADTSKKLTLNRMMTVKDDSGSNASCGSTLVLKALETIWTKLETVKKIAKKGMNRYGNK